MFQNLIYRINGMPRSTTMDYYLKYSFAPKAQLSVTNLMLKDINKINGTVPRFQIAYKIKISFKLKDMYNYECTSVESIDIPSGFEDIDSDPLKPIISATLTLPWRQGHHLAQVKNCRVFPQELPLVSNRTSEVP